MSYGAPTTVSPASPLASASPSSPGASSSHSSSDLLENDALSLLNGTLGLDLDTHPEFVGPSHYLEPVLLDLYREAGGAGEDGMGSGNTNGSSAAPSRNRDAGTPGGISTNGTGSASVMNGINSINSMNGINGMSSSATPGPSTLRLSVRRVDAQTVFLVQPDAMTASESQRLADCDAIEACVRPLGPALVDLYFRMVHPSFPILHRGVFRAKHAVSHRLFSPPLLAAVYLVALDYQLYHVATAGTAAPPPDPGCQAALEQVAERTMVDDLRRPKLSTLQAGLLLLQQQQRSRIATGGGAGAGGGVFGSMFVAQLVALAQVLGLHVDCEAWAIPAWEKGLRRRLAWALYTQDRWYAVLQGRPPLLNDDSWGLRPCSLADFPERFGGVDKGDKTDKAERGDREGKTSENRNGAAGGTGGGSVGSASSFGNVGIGVGAGASIGMDLGFGLDNAGMAIDAADMLFGDMSFDEEALDDFGMDDEGEEEANGALGENGTDGTDGNGNNGNNDNDDEEVDPEDNSAGAIAARDTGRAIFMGQVELAQMLSEILSRFYQATATASTVELVEATKPLVLRLRAWHAALPPNLRLDHRPPVGRLSDNAALHLAHAAVEVTLQRVLLRALSPATPPALAAAVRAMAKARVSSAVAMLTSLQPEHTGAFWGAAAAYQIALVGSLAGLLWATTESASETAWCVGKLDELRWFLQVRGQAVPFMRDALRLLDGVAGPIQLAARR